MVVVVVDAGGIGMRSEARGSRDGEASSAAFTAAGLYTYTYDTHLVAFPLQPLLSSACPTTKVQQTHLM